MAPNPGDATVSIGDMINTSRDFRLKLLDDPHRPAYHFVTPEGYCGPFDPNGNIFWNGRHHMGYIYQHRGVHYWGHASSRDLLHWRHHKPSLFPTPDSPENGIFSGNGFVSKDGKEVVYLYHGCGAGNSIATSSDKDLDNWKKLPGNPIIPNPADDALYRSWDPCGWVEDDTYYAIFGGQRPAIFKAKKLNKWKYVGDLFAHAIDGVDIHEDVSCPDFFKLGRKWVLVCISHRLGCRYYVGKWKNEQFHPEYHEMMTWADNEYFAPESYTGDKGRRILFTWVFDGRSGEVSEPSGWSGTMGLPRVLELGADNRLIMTPAEELQALRYNERSFSNVAVSSRGDKRLGVEGNTIELEVKFKPTTAKEYGVKVCASPGGKEETVIAYDRAEGKLRIDARRSGRRQPKKSVEAAPMKLAARESLKLRVFVDKSIVEVFANDGRLVLSRRIYPERPDSVGVALFAKGGTAKAGVRAWDMMPSNPY